MFKHKTKAALAVFSLLGSEEVLRQEVDLSDHGGGGVGLPQDECRLADQYDIGGAKSSELAMDGAAPRWCSSSTSVLESEERPLGPLRVETRSLILSI